MTKSAPDEGSDNNTKIIKEFRANQGRVGGPWAGTTLILIHHIGARSGVERITPLGCSSQGDGRFVIVASSGGSPIHPDWYYNLKANPRITVEVSTQTFTALADELADAARDSRCPGLKAGVDRPQQLGMQPDVDEQAQGDQDDGDARRGGGGDPDPERWSRKNSVQAALHRRSRYPTPRMVWMVRRPNGRSILSRRSRT